MVFSINGAGTIGYPHAKNEVGLLLIPYEKINANCVKDPTLRTIKLLEGNIGINLDDFELGNGFSGTTSTAKVTGKKKRRKKEKLSFINIKNFCASKDAIKKVKRQLTA